MNSWSAEEGRYAAMAVSAALCIHYIWSRLPDKKKSQDPPTLGWSENGWQGTRGLAAAQTATCAEKTHTYETLQDRLDTSVFDLDTVARLMVGKYKNTWRGHVLLKDAVSLHTYSALMQHQRPCTIID